VSDRAFDLAFITGCGRSGTTILGTIVGKHDEVKYFNDRFDLWVGPMPVTDAWGKGDSDAPARIALDEVDANEALHTGGREAFLAKLDAERNGRPVVVEKIALNNMRLPFLMALFPDAAFVNILRHGVEVARSIARRADVGRWYGQDDRKWRLLQAYTRGVGLGHLLAMCEGPDAAYERGLLEWRLSVEAAADALDRRTPERFAQVRYEDLVAEPDGVVSRLERLLGLNRSERVRAFVAREVGRKSPEAGQSEVPSTTEPIAGDTLRRLGYDG
jgi:hypothetical protein